jgi:acyl-CoA synthetase (NDP forming)
LAGADAASEVFLARLGIGRVSSIPAFMEALKLLHVTGPLDGHDISSMSCSGGEASIMADSAEGRRVAFRPLSPDHRIAIRQTLGPLVAVANPLDYHTFIWNDEPAMTATFSAMVSGGFDLNFLVLDFPRTDRCSDVDWRATVSAFEMALKANGAKGAVLASLPENLSEDWAANIMTRGIAPMQGIDEALDATEAAAAIGTAWKRPFPAPVAMAKAGQGTTRTLDEAEAKAWLRDSGLPVREGRRVANPVEAVAAANAFGYPVAVKALGIAHKSELGAVRLDLRDTEAVGEAADALATVGTGLFVERMVEGGVAELIVGVTRDPLFGPVLTVGSGGVLVELLEDSRTMLLPATRDEIEAAIRALKLFPLLDGYRGRQKADLDAAIDAIEGIARFAVENAGKLVEMDINPLIVCEIGKGAAVADALIVLQEDLQ